MKKRLSREQLLAIKDIIRNYNFGFITKSEYNCQIIAVYTWDSRKQYLWHLACLLPDWVHILIFGIRYQLS